MPESRLARSAARLERELPLSMVNETAQTVFMLYEALRVLYGIVGSFNEDWSPDDRAYIETALHDRVGWGMKGYYVHMVVSTELFELAKSKSGVIDHRLGFAR